MTGVAMGSGSRRACAIHDIHSQVLRAWANEPRKGDAHFWMEGEQQQSKDHTQVVTVLLTRAENTKGLPPKTALDDPWFATDAFDGIAELLPEVMQVEATQVPQLNPFELLPNTLARIQLRGIRRDRLAQLMDIMAVA